MKRILILGGGFGGVEVYRRLHELLHPIEEHGVKVELINRTNYFTFSPMLHEAATGSVAREHVVQPLREVLACCGEDFHQAQVLRVDPTRNIVVTDRGEHSFDYLVVALGVEQGYFGTPGAKEHALALKWLPDAITVRNRVINSFENASEMHDVHDTESMRDQLHFIIVGAGATGTELAGQLSDLMEHEMRKYYGDVPHNMTRITLVHAGDRVLEQLSERGSHKAQKRLEQLGVDVMLKSLVTEVTEEGVMLDSGEFLRSTNVIWTAGTQSELGNILPDDLVDEKGLVPVLPSQQSNRYEHIFAIGDCATVTDPLYASPPLAQAAVHEARIAAKNIQAVLQSKPIVHKRYRHKGDIIPIGDWYAVFEHTRVKFSGRMAWLLRRGVFLKTMYSWTKRLQVIFDWTVRIILPRDTSEF